MMTILGFALPAESGEVKLKFLKFLLIKINKFY